MSEMEVDMVTCPIFIVSAFRIPTSAVLPEHTPMSMPDTLNHRKK